MKRIRFILAGILAILTLSSNLVSADCVGDCEGPYATCVSFCPDTLSDPTDPGAGDRCRLHCVRGLNGCIRRCTKKDENSSHGLQSELPGALPKDNELRIDKIDK